MSHIPCEFKSHETFEDISQMSTNQESQETSQSQEASIGNTGSRIVESWDLETRELLISQVKENYHRLTGRRERRDAVWQDILDIIKVKKPHITVSQVKKKWQNLKDKLQKFEDNKKTTGASRMHTPPCYELLCSFLLEKQAINPQYTQEVGLKRKRSSAGAPSNSEELDMGEGSLQLSRPSTSRSFTDEPSTRSATPNTLSESLSLDTIVNHSDDEEVAEIQGLLNLEEESTPRGKGKKMKPASRSDVIASHLKNMDTASKQQLEYAKESLDEMKRHNQSHENIMTLLLGQQVKACEAQEKRTDLIRELLEK